MIDITKCPGGNCPLKPKCLRYTGDMGEHQMIFTKPPYRIYRKTFKCVLLYADNRESLISELNKKLRHG